MSNSFYNQSGYPAYNADGDSQSARSEFAAIQSGFDKLPTLSGSGLKFIRVNTSGTALEAFNVTASLIPNAPAGGVVATDVQTAINELDTKKVSAANLHAATSKATPVDADELFLTDSANSFSLARLTWANLKATLLTNPTIIGQATLPQGTAVAPPLLIGADGFYGQAAAGGIYASIDGTEFGGITNIGQINYPGTNVRALSTATGIENHAQNTTNTTGVGGIAYGMLLNYTTAPANLIGIYNNLHSQFTFNGPTGTIAQVRCANADAVIGASNLSTINTLYGYFSSNATVSGGSVTTHIGYYATDLTAATNNRGFQGALTAGANKFNLYMAGSADNYLAGDLLIGSLTNDGVNKLQVTGGAYFSGNILRGLSTATTVNTIDPATQLWGVNTQSGASQVLGISGANASGPSMFLTKTRGTNPGDFSAVQAGDVLGSLSWMADDGVDYNSMAARIRSVAEATATSNNTPAYLGFSTNAGAAAVTEVMRLTSGGVMLTKQGATTAKSAVATLTIAELLTGIIEASGTTYALTLPTGTLADAGVYSMTIDTAFEWSIISTASGAITLGAGTAHTIVGSTNIAAGTSARFKSRKTATNTFITYRIA